VAVRILGGEAAAYALVVVVAVALNQHVGNQGYMPLDQSIVYNGAWRLLAGQVPYVDFWLPFGLVPILLQAPLFLLLGVSWTAYVLQASLLNAAFAASMLFLGRRLGLRLGAATLYGGLAAVVAYPPMATPYVDQHAAIFSAWLLAVVLLGILDPARGRRWWLAAPPLFLLAFFSKPVPSAYALLAGGLALVVTARRQQRGRDLLAVTVAALLWAAAAALALRLAGVTAEAFLAQALDAPLALARERATSSEVASEVANEVAVSAEAAPAAVGDAFARRALVVALYALALLPVIAALVVAARARARDPGRDPAILALFAATAFGIAVLFMALTRNQPVSALALVALAWVAAHAALQRLVPAIATAAAAVATAATLLMLGTWVMPRYLNDFEGGVPAGVDAAVISPQLAHLRWALPPFAAGLDADSADSYRRLVAELAGRPIPPVIVSDSVLYPLIGRAPVPPALFWHRTLSFPADGPARAAFDARFRRDILAAGSDLVVMDGPRTWMAVRLATFPWLEACLRPDGRREIGRFSLIPLDRDCLARQAASDGPALPLR